MFMNIKVWISERIISFKLLTKEINLFFFASNMGTTQSNRGI